LRFSASGNWVHGNKQRVTGLVVAVVEVVGEGVGVVGLVEGVAVVEVVCVVGGGAVVSVGV